VATCFIEHIRKGFHFSDDIPDTLSTQMRTVSSLASYAVDSLEKDALYAIEKGIKDYIRAAFPEVDGLIRRQLRRQAAELNLLCQSLHPFDNSKEATERLLLSLYTSTQSIQSGLKNLPKMDVHEWVRGIYSMVSPPASNLPQSSSTTSRTAARLGAPFFRQGSSPVIFAQVFDALHELCEASDWRAQRDFCVEAIVAQMESHCVFRYPHSAHHHATRRPTAWAQYHSWVDLVYPHAGQMIMPPDHTTADPDRLAAHIASTQITENNPQASWNWSEVKLSDLPWIIKRSRLPLDWTHAEIMQDPMCEMLSTWLKDSYTISDPRFHLSLIAALILTAWAPNHCIKHQSDKVSSKVAKNANMVEYGSTLAWDLEHKEAGWTARSPLFHVWLIFISGVLVDTSPWWQLTKEKLETKTVKLRDRTSAQLANREMLSKFQSKIRKFLPC
jgi:hypothetical protein